MGIFTKLPGAAGAAGVDPHHTDSCTGLVMEVHVNESPESSDQRTEETWSQRHS